MQFTEVSGDLVAAKMTEGEKVTIHVPENCEEEGCFLVSFANGQVRPTSSAMETKFSLYHKGGTASKKRKIMVAETEKMSYVGTNYDENSQTSTANLCKYYIGALDRKKGTMSVRRAELMHLRPYIPGKTDLGLSTEESPVKRERSEVQDEMVALFGSEKQKRAFAAYKRNKVGSEALETALATAVTHAEASLEAPDGAPVVQGSGLAPPFNPQAEVPQDVYNISDIISLEDLRVVKETGKVLTSASKEDIVQWRDKAIYPGYVLSRIPSIPSSEPEQGLKAAILLYCGWFIQIYMHNQREFEKKGLQLSGELPPLEVKANLLEKFSEAVGDASSSRQGKRKISRKMKDKILLHLLVLTLILDDFSVDCSVLQQDLKLTTKKLMENYKSLGCRVSKMGVKRKSGVEEVTVDTTSCTAVLRIPLEFPRPRKGRKSK